MKKPGQLFDAYDRGLLEVGLQATVRVLVVEDELFVAEMLADSLGDHGFAVTAAYSVDEALDLLITQVFEVAVVDYTLHKVTCHGVVSKLQEKGIPFLICSGWHVAAIAEQFPGVQVVSKPYRVSTVADSLRRLLA